MAKELTVFFALAWVAIFVATFATLGGGKIGAGIIEALCIATIYAGIHAGMQHEYPENGGTCEVNPMWPRNPLGRTPCDVLCAGSPAGCCRIHIDSRARPRGAVWARGILP